MENKNPQLEGYQKVLFVLCFLCMMASLVLVFFIAFEVVSFPLIIIFVPMVMMNILGTIAFWKHATKPMRIALLLSIPTLIFCAVFFQMHI